MNIEQVRKQYKKNEANNNHSANAVLLAKHFGTEEDLIRAEYIQSEHEKHGSIPDNLYRERYELSQPLYRIMMGIGK